MGLTKDKLIYDGTTPSDGDSVAAFLHASNKLTSTTVGGKEALDVNLASPISVATDLDGLYDVSTNPTPDTVGSIIRTRGAAPDATTQVEPITGAAASSDGVVAANVHGMDSNSFLMGFNGTTWDRIKSSSGKLLATIDGNVADDGVDTGNPIKVGGRAVDADAALAAISAAGDRSDLIMDLYRRVQTADAPNVAGSNAAVSVDTTVGGVALFATPLPGRQWASIQNLGSKAIYIGFGTVSAANGTRIAAGATEQVKIGKALALKAIAESGTQDVRVLQFA